MADRSFLKWNRRFEARAFVVLFGACCCVIEPYTTAHAAEADKVAARAHYETATRMFEVREYAEALKEYKAAYIAKPDPAFLFNIGQCYRKMGKDAEALEFFQQFLKKTPLDDPNRDLVEARIRNIRSGVAPDHDPFDHAEAARSRSRQTSDESAASLNPLPVTSTAVAIPAVGAKPTPSFESSLAVGLTSSRPLVRPSSGPRQLSYELTASAPLRPDQRSPPIYRKWWFWTGAGAVVVVGAITVIALSSGGGTTIPSSTLGSKPVLP
jgi:hypothetical protein